MTGRECKHVNSHGKDFFLETIFEDLA